MKHLFIIILLATFPAIGFGQVFYVEPTEKRYEKEIARKLDFAGYKVTTDKSKADFNVSHHYQKNKRNYKFEGYIKVSGPEGTEVYRTDIVKKAANAFNGYQAMPAVVSELTEKDLIPKIKSGLVKVDNKR